MEKKSKKLIKQLLTTVSAVAVLSTGVNSALGLNVTTGGNVAALRVGDATSLDNPFINGFGIKLGGAHTITTGESNLVITAVDLNDFNTTLTVTAGHKLSLGFVKNLANAANTLSADIKVGSTLVLTGTPGVDDGGLDLTGVDDYSRLGAFTFNNVAGTLEINKAAGAITVTNDATNHANAVLNVVTSLTANKTYLGFGTINVGSNAAAATMTVSASANADINQVNFLHADATLDIESNGAGRTFTVANGTLGGNADNQGKLVVKTTGGDTIITGAAAGNTVGLLNNRLKELKIEGNNHATFAKAVFAKKVDLNAGAARNRIFTGGLNTGTDGSVIFSTNNNTLQLGATSTIGTIDFNDNDSTVEIAADANLATTTVTAKATAGVIAATKGKLNFAGNSNFTGTAVNLTSITGGAVNSTLTIGAGNHTVGNVILAAGGTIAFADGANIGATVAGGDGDVNNGAGAAGKIDFLGNSTIAGVLGSAGHLPADVNIKGGKDKVVSVAGNILATNINFTDTAGAKLIAKGNVTAATNFVVDGTLELAGAANHTVTGAIAIDKGVKNIDGVGTINVAADVAGNVARITGAVGDIANADGGIKEIRLNAATNKLKLDGGDQHIRKITLAGDNEIELGSAHTFRIGSIDHGNNQGKIKITANNVVIQNDALTEDQLKDLGSIKRLSKVTFDADHTAKIADGSSLFTKAVDVTGADHRGTMNIAGAAIIDAPMGIRTDGGAVPPVAAKLTAINLYTGGVGGDKQIRWLSNIDSNGAITFANDGNFVFEGVKIASANVNGITGAAGTLTLKNLAAEQEVAAKVDANVAVVFAGGNAKFTVTPVSAKYTFDNDKAITVDLAAQDISAVNFIVNKDNVLNTVKYNSDASTLAGALGKDKGLIIEAGAGVAALTINPAAPGNAAQARFTTTKDAGTTITVEGADADAVSAIGTAAKPFENIVLNSDIELTVGDVYSSKTITITPAQTVKFTGAVNAEIFSKDRSIALTAAKSIAEFSKDNIVLATTVNGVGGDKGQVVFTDINSTVAADLGTAAAKLVKVSFLATSTEEVIKKTNLNANIYSADIDFGKTTLVAQAEEVKLAGAVKFADSTVAVGKNTITANSIAFSGASTIETSFDGAKAGTLVNAANGALTFAAGSTLDIVVNDSSGQIARDAVTVTVLDNKGNSITEDERTAIVSKAKVTVKNNDLVNWVLSVGGTGTVKLTRESKASQVLAKDITEKLGIGAKEELAVVDLVLAADRNSDAGKFADSLVTMDALNRAEAVQRIIASTQQGDESASNISAIGQRLGTFMSGSAAPAASVTPNARVASAEVSGLAAGDEAERFGVWGMPFFGTATQNKHKGTPGYKSESAGGTLGFDTKVNDGLVVGAAFTYASSDIKHKDSKKGDKTKSEATMLSVYGLQQLTDSWFAQAVGTVGDNSVKTESIRVVANNKKETAKGKYSSMSFAGQALFGYNYGLAGVEVTPMFGLGFTRVNDGSYKETGTANQNLDINKKASNKLEGILGAKLSLANVNVGEALVTPELHGFVYHNFNKKDQQVAVRMDGIKSSLPQKSNKSVKTTFNAGLGVTAKYGMMEYGAGYDAHMATKYLAHQGTLKVRVNF